MQLLRSEEEVRDCTFKPNINKQGGKRYHNRQELFEKLFEDAKMKDEFQK